MRVNSATARVLQRRVEGINCTGCLPRNPAFPARSVHHATPITPREHRTRDWGLVALGIALGAGAVYASSQGVLDWSARLDSAAPASKKRENSKKEWESNIISFADLGRHRTSESLWVAIEGTVWDVTEFVGKHPGGPQILFDNAGTDVTEIFNGLHPPGTAEANLGESRKVGKLEDKAEPQHLAAQWSPDMRNDNDIDKRVGRKGETEAQRIKRARSELIGVNSIASLDDLERLVEDLLPAPAWEYYSTGADSESAMRNNASVYDRVFFRPRVMREVADVDTSTTILGVQSSVPFYVSPTAKNGLGQPEGELVVTRGAAAQGAFQVLSHVASKSLEEVLAAAEKGQKIGWQLYMHSDRAKAEQHIRKAVELGAHSIWLTVDTTILGKRMRQVTGLAERNPAPTGSALSRGPVSSLLPSHDAQLAWSDIEWIKSLAPGIPIVVKGIGAWEARQDVELAKKYGADAVVLSNHGGRQLDFANASLKTLYDVRQNAPHLLGRSDFSVFIDGGIKRGTDVLKALCLGANAVGLGRPFIYAGTGWGSEGVEKTIMLLKGEIEISMRLLGVTRVDQLGPEYLNCERL